METSPKLFEKLIAGKTVAGVYTLPSGKKIAVWYDEDGEMHVNGLGAVITPDGPQ